MIRLNNRGRFNDVSALILRSQTITKNVFHSVFLHIPFFSHTFCFWLPKIDLERNTIISRSCIGVEKAGNHELPKTSRPRRQKLWNTGLHFYLFITWRKSVTAKNSWDTFSQRCFCTSCFLMLFIAFNSPNLVHQHWKEKKTTKSPKNFDLDSRGGGRDSAYERGGDGRRKFGIKPLKETNLGVAQPFFDP